MYYRVVGPLRTGHIVASILPTKENVYILGMHVTSLAEQDFLSYLGLLRLIGKNRKYM